MNPKVTVLMPVFNREQLIGEAVASVLAQDFDDYELLIVDDGSTDGTADVLAKWVERDRRVVVVSSPANEGIRAALNRGLAEARGEYVARLDSDDLMTPHRLAAQVAVLDACPEVALVSCAYDITDLAGNPVGRWQRDEPPEVTRFLLNFFNVVGGHGQVMFRRREVLERGGYAQELVEDYDLWVRLGLRGGWIETLPLVGMIKRTHPHQEAHSVARRQAVRASWSRIMRSSLEPLLRRSVTDEEIAALLTLWRLDGRVGSGPVADAFMREAFASFCRDVPDPALQSCARRRVARQWYLAARNFARRGHPLEVLRYLARSARWHAGLTR